MISCVVTLDNKNIIIMSVKIIYIHKGRSSQTVTLNFTCITMDPTLAVLHAVVSSIHGSTESNYGELHRTQI